MVYEFIKIHQAVHLVSVYFTVCNYKYPPLFENLPYAASILRKPYISMFLLTERNLQRIFIFMGETKAKSIQHSFCGELL